ncbi:MAG: hypothetical protein HFH03_07760 [Dorea sp.]|nr:hypothetical protein [Dorea sp.]
MKKMKQILALTGALLLFAMYAATLVFALIGSEHALTLLKADIACTIIVPVFLYAYTLVYRILKKDDPDSE